MHAMIFLSRFSQVGSNWHSKFIEFDEDENLLNTDVSMLNSFVESVRGLKIIMVGTLSG